MVRRTLIDVSYRTARLWQCLVVFALLVSTCHCSLSSWATRSPQHWRRLLGLTEAVYDSSYNGSAVLSTYPILNNTGASLRKLLPSAAGYVQKAGPAEMLNWSQKPHYAVAREAIFLNWRQQELTNPAPQLFPGQELTCAAARHPPVPFHHCHVFVNHEYRVAYVRSPKSASTSIMNWMGQCRYNKTRNWNSTTCLSYTWERYQTPEQVASIWKDYFFFGFVRNPWARAYSLYKDMTGTNHFLHKHGPRCQMEWGRFCRNPFFEFDRLYDNGCSHKPPHYSYWHMMDQYHCMITSTGEWAVDFLGRVERGNEDWKVVVDEMNKRRLPGVPEVQFSALDHIHKVDLAPAAANTTIEQQQQELSGQQQQQQQHLHHSRHPTMLPADMQERQDMQQQQPSPITRLFRHLWRRVRVAAAAYDLGDTAAAAGGAAGAPVNSDPDGSSGPYIGANEHCIDAVSQWYACDIDKFGYLPPLAPAPDSTMADASADASTSTDASASTSTSADASASTSTSADASTSTSTSAGARAGMGMMQIFAPSISTDDTTDDSSAQQVVGHAPAAAASAGGGGGGAGGSTTAVVDPKHLLVVQEQL